MDAKGLDRKFLVAHPNSGDNERMISQRNKQTLLHLLMNQLRRFPRPSAYFFAMFLMYQNTSLAVSYELINSCVDQLSAFPGQHDLQLLTKACQKIEVLPECQSVNGTQIFHFDKLSKDPRRKSVLVFSLIHGDEVPAGSVGRYWMERLSEIDPRNTWRVVPILNPDGLKLKTRTNARKIDLNRNFPTRDWEELAVTYWKKSNAASPRRFPGDQAGSEPEVKCALKHLEEFQPDFVVSVHTPLKVLDFDGPKINTPHFDYLPWKSLGHYPGSLGRYLWFERKTPVLTMELRDSLPKNNSPFDRLQDIIGTLVMLEMKGGQIQRTGANASGHQASHPQFSLSSSSEKEKPR